MGVINEKTLISLIESKMPFEGEAGLDNNLFNDLGYDSILLLDLIITIEEKYNFSFNENELSIPNFETPRKILQILNKI